MRSNEPVDTVTGTVILYESGQIAVPVPFAEQHLHARAGTPVRVFTMGSRVYVTKDVKSRRRWGIRGTREEHLLIHVGTHIRDIAGWPKLAANNRNDELPVHTEGQDLVINVQDCLSNGDITRRSYDKSTYSQAKDSSVKRTMRELRKLLANGPVPSQKVRDWARQNGLTGTLYAASKKLGISYRGTGDGKYKSWFLPETPPRKSKSKKLPAAPALPPVVEGAIERAHPIGVTRVNGKEREEIVDSAVQRLIDQGICTGPTLGAMLAVVEGLEKQDLFDSLVRLGVVILQ